MLVTTSVEPLVEATLLAMGPLEEPFEEPLDKIGWGTLLGFQYAMHARKQIENKIESYFTSLILITCNSHRAFLGSEFQCIGYKITQDLANFHSVANRDQSAQLTLLN